MFIMKIIIFAKEATIYYLSDCDREMSVIYDNIMCHYRIDKISVN